MIYGKLQICITTTATDQVYTWSSMSSGIARKKAECRLPRQQKNFQKEVTNRAKEIKPGRKGKNREGSSSLLHLTLRFPNTNKYKENDVYSPSLHTRHYWAFTLWAAISISSLIMLILKRKCE